MSEDKRPEPLRESLPKPEHGADSQLHCYNAVSWRLAELFGEEDDAPPAAAQQK